MATIDTVLREEIFFIDLLLSGDNAIVIALACQGLPAQQVPKAVALGAAGAIFFRLVIATVAGTLLTIPLLKIVGGALLLVIAINLLAGEHLRRREGDAGPGFDPIRNDAGFMGAVFVILIVDAIMSLDNVVALAAVSEGNLLYLIGGLLFSVPLIFFGSLVVTKAMKHFPTIILVGTAFLGWVAGGMLVSDPVWSGWIVSHAEALSLLVPLACVVFVVVEGRITARARSAAAAVAETNLTGATPPKPARGSEAAPRRVEAPPSASALEPAKAEARAPAQPATRLPAFSGPAVPGVLLARDDREAVTPAAGNGDRIVLVGLVILFCVVAVVMAAVVAAGSRLG
ncbi:UNVERIFIED_ORG: YjbE family integral membrane protein [Xanthobacter viscosus]|uniref:YjbE family putative metal transport protein n=1 Tax=Xanthobacter autotrophicus TaxID=280 RepID=A0A6C1KCP1_XANAU|nr:TerC family protein [Xanthobacter autotrophicus]TLX41571.1 YjbE family putative metal transport protein [Xanthobacter autotrophicus]